MDARATFFKVYANLQLDLRKEIILTVKDDDGHYRPITWNVAFNEISNNTKLGKIILKKITEMGLI